MNTDHIVLDPKARASNTKMVMLCQFCGARGEIKLPLPIAMIGKASAPFIEKHAACKPPDLVDEFRNALIADWMNDGEPGTRDRLTTAERNLREALGRGHH